MSVTDQKQDKGSNAVWFALALIILVFISASLFQLQTIVFQPPLIAYWFLTFAVFLRPWLIVGLLVPLLFAGHIVAIFAVRYIEQHGLPVGHSFVAILQTEGGEAFAYISRSLTTSDWVSTGVFSALLGLLLLALKRQSQQVLQATQGLRPAFAFVYLLALSGVIYVFSGLHAQASVAYQSVQQTSAAFQSELQSQEALREQFGHLQWQGPPLQAGFSGTTVLVIGESTSRHHMKLYGYPRDTTPFLSSIADRLLKHDDAISAHSYTIQSLTDALSSANRDDDRTFAQAPDENVLSAAQAAGIKTFWFSNQNKYGIWDNLVSLLGQGADISEFTRKSFGKFYHFRSFDHELLPLLDQALDDPAERKLIVLHLYATHFPYCDFVPESHRYFQLGGEFGKRFFGNARDMSQAVNCYDDGVRYVDAILQQVITRADSSDAPMLVTYLSDHGEDPAGGTAHEIPLHRGPHVEIPLLVYANDKARPELGAELAAFAANADKPFKSSDLYHTLLDILLQPSDAVRHDRSLFSAGYRPYERTTIASDEGPEFVLYDRFDGDDNKDYAEKARANLTGLRNADEPTWRRVWAHRVDTIGKLLEAKQIFSGVEADLVYSPSDDAFHVHHPPAESTGLTLREYLLAAADRPNMGLWLDWKNASDTDLVSALTRLDHLNQEFSLKTRSVVELPIDFPLERAADVRGFDWPLSYYLPTEQIIQCSDAPTPACDKLVEDIVLRAKAFGVRYLSFDYRGRGFVRRHADKLGRYELIGWDLSKNVTEHDLSQVDVDAKLKILLVSLPSLFYY